MNGSGFIGLPWRIMVYSIISSGRHTPSRRPELAWSVKTPAQDLTCRTRTVPGDYPPWLMGPSWDVRSRLTQTPASFGVVDLPNRCLGTCGQLRRYAGVSVCARCLNTLANHDRGFGDLWRPHHRAMSGVPGGAMGESLKVVVNNDLVLDAGWWEEIERPFPQRLVHPPVLTMFDQVLGYLEQVAQDLPDAYYGFSLSDEAIAATAVCLRWGSYLAVLLDRAKPVCAGVKDPTHSRISDSEMARISIEASAALAQWISIMRHDWPRHQSLVRASWSLPMPQKKIRRDRDYVHLYALGTESFAEKVDWPRDGEAYERVVAHPTRTLANALIEACWRNGPVEDVHAGVWGSYPLTQRRVAVREEQALIRTTAERLANGLYGFAWTEDEDPDSRPWLERVLPYGFAQELLVTPTNWSLEESSREVRLPGWEKQ